MWLGVLSTKPVSGMSRADVECVACCMLKTILNQLTHGNDNFASVLALVRSNIELYLFFILLNLYLTF